MATCVDCLRSGVVADPLSRDVPASIYDFAELSSAYNHSKNEEKDELWHRMREEARKDVEQEPVLGSYYICAILAHGSLESALATHLGYRLATPNLPGPNLAEVFLAVLLDDRAIRTAIREDMRAIKERDPACVSYVQIMLNFKGFLAIQAHRVAHRLWLTGRVPLALVIQNRVSEVFAVDIHPGARIGKGVLLDHATGTVIGETAVIGDNVSILHNVTLGGTGKCSGDRHPKIGDGVLVGAGTHVLGNVRIGHGAKIGAGSVVLKEVPERTTAVGNPARLLGGMKNPIKLTKIPSFTMDHTYEWICCPGALDDGVRKKPWALPPPRKTMGSKQWVDSLVLFHGKPPCVKIAMERVVWPRARGPCIDFFRPVARILFHSL